MTEIETKADTLQHIQNVGTAIHKIVGELLRRADVHDDSKLESPELESFAEAGLLADLTYGSPEYQESKDKLGAALEHHYARHRHHIQHFPNGIKGMNIVDFVEMFCDWYASSRRQNDGNLHKSIQRAADEFGLGPQLVAILENSVEILE